MHRAHLKVLQAHEALLREQLEGYAQAFAAAGFEPSASSPASGAKVDPCAWLEEAVLRDPTSGLEVVLGAHLVSACPSARRITHQLQYVLSLRAPGRPDVTAMTFELCSFSDQAPDAAQELAEGVEGTPAGILLYFADRALGR